MQTISMPGILVSSETERVAKLRAATYDHQDLPDDISFLEWAEIFGSYITQNTDGGHITVELDEKQAPEGDFADAARISCAVFNALPAQMRTQPSSIKPQTYQLSTTNAASTPCQDEARWNTYIWGGSLYMNHCLIQDVNAYVGNASKIAALISATLASTGIGMPATIIITAASAFVSVNAAWLVQADSHCGGSGAFLQIPWISIGTPFVKQNC